MGKTSKAPAKKVTGKKGSAYVIQTKLSVTKTTDESPKLNVWVDDGAYKSCGSTAEALKQLRDKGHVGEFRIIAIKAQGEAESETKSTLKLS